MSLSLSLSLIRVDNFHRTSSYCKRARSIKETYAAIVKANIYFFLTSLSFTYSRICQALTRRTRSVALYRKWSLWRRKKKWGSSLFLKACAYTHTYITSYNSSISNRKKRKRITEKES